MKSHLQDINTFYHKVARLCKEYFPMLEQGEVKVIIMISAHSDKVSLFQPLTFLCQICMAKQCVVDKQE